MGTVVLTSDQGDHTHHSDKKKKEREKKSRPLMSERDAGKSGKKGEWATSVCTFYNNIHLVDIMHDSRAA